MKNIYTKIGLALMILIPSISFAASKTLSDLVIMVIRYLNQALFLIIALATVTFVWNIYKYFVADGGSDKKEAGLYVMFSVIGFFVILSFWGLVMILKNTLNLDGSRPESIPASLDFNSKTFEMRGTTNNLGGMEQRGSTVR